MERKCTSDNNNSSAALTRALEKYSQEKGTAIIYGEHKKGTLRKNK